MSPDTSPLPLPRDPARREFRVGIFAIIGFLCFLTLLFTMTDVAPLRGRYNVTAHVRDAGGLRRGEPVLLHGVNIGRVRKFRIDPTGVTIHLELHKDFSIPVDSRLVLRSRAVLAGLSAEIVPGQATSYLRDGDVLKGGKEEGFLERFHSAGNRADSILASVNSAFDSATVRSVQNGVDDFAAALFHTRAMIGEQRKEVAELSASLRAAATQVQNAVEGDALQRSIARMDTLSRNLEHATASLDSVLSRMERGEGTLGRLSKDETLYENVSSAARNVDLLAEDIRKHPERYIKIRIF